MEIYDYDKYNSYESTLLGDVASMAFEFTRHVGSSSSEFAFLTKRFDIRS